MNMLMTCQLQGIWLKLRNLSMDQQFIVPNILEYHQNSLSTMATILNCQLTFQEDKYDFHWNLYPYINADDLSISVDLITNGWMN